MKMVIPLQWKPPQPEVVASIQNKNLMNSKAVRDITRTHYSLGHICADTMKKLMKSNAIHCHNPQLVDFVVSHCEPCRLTKAKACKIPLESLTPAPSTLHLIHCDEVTGLPCTPSGYTRFSLIIDCKTKFVDIKLIRRKNEAVQHIKDFVVTAKTYGFQVMCLHTDSTKAFSADKSFIQWLEMNGI